MRQFLLNAAKLIPETFGSSSRYIQRKFVWTGFSSNFILGPYFYQSFNENGDLISMNVNGANYYEMLDELAEMGASWSKRNSN
jgi:hypothetical protein